MDNNLTLFVALYGALLSTYVLIREIQKDKRRIEVSCQVGIGQPPLHGSMLEYLSIVIINTGHRQIQITMAGLMLSDGSKIIQPFTNTGSPLFPKTLEDGESLSVLLEFSELKSSLAKRENRNATFDKAFVNDAEGNTYFAKLPRVMKHRSWMS